MIDPGRIPQFTGDLAQLEKDYGDLKSDASHVRSTGRDVHAGFQGLSAYYTAPEAERLFATTKPVAERAEGFAGDLETVSSALSSYATEIRPLVAKLTQLKIDATAFVDSVGGDDDWEYDGDKVDHHNRIRDDVTAAVAAFWAAERTCHNKITALFGGTQMVAGDGSERKDQYGFDAEDMKNAKLPWGDPVEERHHWYEVGHWVKSFVWDGLIVDGVWGTIKGLGTLVGFGGWEAMGQAWKGLAQLATGLVISSMPGVGVLFWALPDDKLPSWLRDSRTAMKETGKALVAWDEWGKNPARAAGAVTFNVLTTVFTGGAGGAASGAGKAGAVAKALSLAGKAGRVIDPMTYIAKGAGAGLSKIGDISKALKGVGAIDIPKLPDGSVHLPDGRLLDTDGNLIGHDGTIDTTPAPHETVPGLPADWTIQEPALSGVRAADGVPDGIHGHAPSGTFDGPPPSYAHAPPTTPHGHAPAPSTFDHTSTVTPHGHAPTPSTFEHAPTATPHDAPVSTPHPGAGHDLPHGPGHDTPSGHGDDGTHGSGPDHHDGAGHDHHGGEHDGSGHTDDVAGHGDDAAHTGDHAGDGHANPHGGADEGIEGAGRDDSGTPGASGQGDTFEYRPQVSDERWADLSTAEKHRIAYAEISQGTVPFHSSTEAIKYGQAYWNHYAESMPEVQRKAVYDYTVEPNYVDGPPTPEGWGTYKEMNGFLRGDTTKWSPYVQHNIDEVDRALAGNPVPEDLMVVRGSGIGHLNLDDPLEMLGRTYDDKGFMSTSLGDHPVPAFAGEDALLHLRVPKGTPALWVERVSKFGMGERELLLGRGTQFRVTRVFMDNGQVQVYGEVLPR